MDIAGYFDFTIKTPSKKTGSKRVLPIEFADNPDVSALSEIWKDKKVTLEQRRQKALGDRL